MQDLNSIIGADVPRYINSQPRSEMCSVGIGKRQRSECPSVANCPEADEVVGDQRSWLS